MQAAPAEEMKSVQEYNIMEDKRDAADDDVNIGVWDVGR